MERAPRDFPRPRGARRVRPTFHAPTFPPALHRLARPARGLRNPWDIAFDDGFDWLGCDQDQNEGNRFFMPFAGAHFGWGHPWSAHWTGRGVLHTAPVSGPVFAGSGTGMVWSAVPGWPASHRGVFFANDWLLKKTCVWRPRWDGALRVPEGDPFAAPLITGGKAVFRPTDLAFGADGAPYLLGWGRPYGLVLEKGEMANEGRIYRVTPRGFAARKDARAEKRARPLAKWTFDELAEDLSAWIPARRTDAADELVRRGAAEVAAAPPPQNPAAGAPPEQSATRRRSHLAALLVGDLPLAQRTWALWTLGRIAPGDADGDAFFTAEKIDRINALRILGFRAAKSARPISPAVIAALTDAEPRVRLAAVLALRETRQGMDALIASLSAEKDRVSFLAAWQALREIAKPDKLRALLRDERAGVRRAALLALLEDRVLTAEEAALFTKDSDAPLAQTAALYVVKIGGQPAPAAAVKDDGWPLRIAPANLSTASGRAAAVSALRVGAHAYTDRTYTLTRVPEALAGATFLQTPNEDSGSRGAGALAFDLPMAATVSRRKTPQRPRAFRALNLPGAPLSPLTTAPFGTATADVLNDREMSGSQVRITTADRTKFENAPTRRVEGVERNRPGATFLPLTFFTA